MGGHNDIKCSIYLFHIPCIPYSIYIWNMEYKYDIVDIYVYYIVFRLSSSSQSDQSKSRRMWEAIMTLSALYISTIFHIFQICLIVYHIIFRFSSSTQSDQSRSRRMWEAIMTFNGFSTTLCGPVANLWKAGHSSA